MIEAGIIFLIIFTPIHYGSVTLGSTTIMELTILFMVLLWGMEMAVRGHLVFRRTPLDIFILLFCGYSVISTLFFSKYAYASYMGLSLVLCISALYFIVVNHIRSRTQLVRLFMAILIAGSIHAFSHLLNNAMGMLRASTGVMLNVGNHFAGYMVIIIPLIVAMSFVVKDVGKRVILMFAGIIMAAAMAFSLIAGAMLAFFLSLIIIGILLAGSEGTRRQALILVGVVLCSLLIILWFGHAPVLKELLTVTDLKHGSPAGRLSMWKSSLAIFADNPVTGTGLGTFDFVYPQYRLPDMIGRAVYAHSDWIQLLTEMGIVGLVIVLAGISFSFLWVLRKKPVKKLSNDWSKGLAVGGLSSTGAGLAHALVEFNFHIPAIAVLFTIIIALTVAVLLDSQYTMRDSSVHSPSQWKMRIPTSLRIGGVICLLLIIGFSSLAIVRPWIADYHYQNGLELEGELHWDEAADKYGQAMDLAGGNGDYPYALGSVYARRVTLTKGIDLHEKWLNLALDACGQAIAICPINENYYLLLGNLYGAVGNAKEADAAYAKTISLDPNNAFHRRIYGNFLLKQGDVQKSIAEYKKALDIYPNYLYNTLKDCYIALGVEDSMLDANMEHPMLSIARGIHSQDVKSYMTVARFYESKGWYDAAFSEYEQAIELEPERIDVRTRLSNMLARLERLPEAVAIWEKFLESYSQDSQAYGQLAILYTKQGRLDEAIQQYLSAASVAPDNSDYFMKVADLYMRQGESTEALDLWQRVIKENPHKASAHHRLGRYYEAQGDWIGALDSYERAVKSDPRNVGYHLRLAQSYYERELFYEAINEWKRALKLQPENVSVNLYLARVYQQINRQDKAKEFYWEVLKLQPDNVEAAGAIRSGPIREGD
jgi:tetratricopeptide (TPR) repeat protein